MDAKKLRTDFPILNQKIKGQPLVYLDNAATTQKPKHVLEASRQYYEEINSNIHRGTHHLSQTATAAHENARNTVAKFLNANTADEIIFTSGTTDSINLVASSLGRSSEIQEGDEILLTHLEHHSNIVPWQMLAERTGAKIRVIPIHDDGTLDLTHLDDLLTKRTKILAITHHSNALGTPIEAPPLIAKAKALGALTLLDGAQAIAHEPVNVQTLGCDFYAFSGHKIYAPTGIGVLYGRKDLLERLPPWRGGGEMIKEVTFEKTTYNAPPFKYEAGTPNIEGAIALAAALEYLKQWDWQSIQTHEKSLITHTAQGLENLPGMIFYGPKNRLGSLSFNVKGVHHYDLGTLLDQMGIAVRTGHHCCQPLMARLGITGTVRASFALYNTEDEVQKFLTGVERALNILT